MSTVGATPDRGDSIIADRIEVARRQIWRSELMAALLVWTIILIALLFSWSIIDHWFMETGTLSRLAAWLLIVSASIGWACYKIVPLLRGTIHPEYAAQRLEQQLPQLHHSLLSYLTLRDDRNLPGLRGVVVRSIASHAARRLSNPNDALARERNVTMLSAILLALIIALAVYSMVTPKGTLQSFSRALLPLAKIDSPSRVRINDVTPGNTSVVEGTSLKVGARVSGLRRDEQVWVQTSTGSSVRRYSMVEAEDSGQFHGIIDGMGDGIRNELEYQIIGGDAHSPRYQIAVQSVPIVAIDSVTYRPPAYTKLPVRRNSRGAIDALEGTQISVVVKTNRPVESGKIEFNPRRVGDSWHATGGVEGLHKMEDDRTYSGSWMLNIPAEDLPGKQIDSYRIVVKDANGIVNANPVVYPINISADLAPEVSIIVPERSPKTVATNMEQLFEIHALDPDFGLTRLDLEVSKNDRVIGSRSIFQSDEALMGQQISMSSFRSADWNLAAGDIVTVRCRAFDNRNLSDNDLSNLAARQRNPAGPNTSLSDAVELRIVKPNQDEGAQDDNDGLRQQQETPAEQNGEGSKGSEGQQGGSGGEGAASQQKSEDENATGEQGSGTSSESNERKPSSESGSNSGSNPDNKPHEGTDESDSSPSDSGESLGENQEPSPSRSEDHSPSNGGKPGSDASNAQEGDNPHQDSHDANPSDTDNAATSENQEQRVSNPPTSGDDSTGQGSSNSDESDSNSSSNSNSEGDGDSETGDQDDLHDGDIMDRIREHMQEHDKQNSASSKQPDSEGDASQQPSQSPQEPTSKDDHGAKGSDQSNPGESGSPPRSDDTQSDQGSQRNQDNADQAADLSGSDKPAADPSGSDNESGDGSDNSDSASDPNRSNPGDESQTGDDQTGKSDQSKGPSEDESSGAKENNSTPSDQAQNHGPQKDQTGKKPSELENSPKSSDKPDDSMPQSDGESRQSKAKSGSPESDQSPSSKGNDAGVGSEQAPDLAAEEANLEYAEKATDLVLDYLKRQQEQPDPELLDKLNWTDEDLRSFLNRWETARDLGRNGNPQQQEAFLEQLESLGMRPKSKNHLPGSKVQPDHLKDIKDSGSRTRPPAIYRDSFEAFRRSLAQ